MMPWKKNGAIATYLLESDDDITAADLCEDIFMDGCVDPIDEVEERTMQEMFAGKLPKAEGGLWKEIFGTDRTITEMAERHGVAKEAMVKRIAKLVTRYLDFREG